MSVRAALARVRRSARRLHLLEAGADEVSSTSSPTDDAHAADQRRVDRDDVRLSLRPKRFSSAVGDIGQLRRVDREGAVRSCASRRRRRASSTSALELRRDLGQHGEAAVVDHACAAGSSQLAGGSVGVPAMPVTSVEDLVVG